MSNLIPGNQKHLTLDNRVFIEKCLDRNMTMNAITKPISAQEGVLSARK